MIIGSIDRARCAGIHVATSEAPHSEAIAPSCSSFSSESLLIHGTQISADLLDAPGDAVAALRSQDTESLNPDAPIRVE